MIDYRAAFQIASPTSLSPLASRNSHAKATGTR